MTKLYEQLNSSKGAVVSITVGDLTKEITLGVFSIENLFTFEKEGINLQQLMTNMQENPATFGARLAWELMVDESKAEFNNDIVTFRKCLNVGNMAKLGEALTEVIVESMPTEKNEQGPQTK